VESAFSPAFRVEYKDIAVGGNGKRNPNSYLFIPVGDVHDADDDPPPSTELLPHVAVRYLQGNEDSCLRHSMVSALHSMGFVSEAKVLAADVTLLGCTVELVQRATNVIRKVFREVQLGMQKLHKHACSVEQIAKQDASWPIVLILQTSDGYHGTHAVTTWNRMIYDSNSTHAMRCAGRRQPWIGVVERAPGALASVGPIKFVLASMVNISPCLQYRLEFTCEPTQKSRRPLVGLCSCPARNARVATRFATRTG
jgi:hypothetical protein